MSAAKPAVLDAAAARERVAALKGWTLAPDGRAIRLDLSMQDFSAATELLARVALIADALDHHPDVHLTGYRRLVLEVTTHSAGGLTEVDFRLAREIDALPKRLKA